MSKQIMQKNRIETEACYWHFQTWRKATTFVEIRKSSKAIIFHALYNRHVGFSAATLERLARVRYFCEEQSNWALSLSAARPHGGRGSAVAPQSLQYHSCQRP